MNIEIIHRSDAIGRSLALARQIALTSGGQALVAELESVHATISALGDRQFAAGNESSAGVAARALTAADLRRNLRIISSVARHLDPELFPGVAARFRMPRGNGYTDMRNTARAFLEQLDPDLRAVFVDRLGPEPFEQISVLLDDFAAYTERKDVGRVQQMASTAALWQAARRGLAILRELDPIMEVRAQPAMFAAWKSASHVERRRKRKQPEPAVAATAPATTEAVPALPRDNNGFDHRDERAQREDETAEFAASTAPQNSD